MDNRGYCADYQDTLESTTHHPTEKPTSQESIPPSYNIRSTIAQSLATLVDGTSLVSIGFLITAPAIIIANVQNMESGLYMNDSQLSWYASLLPISEPFGCFFGGLFQNYIGRKHGLLIMHITCALAWLVLSQASNVEMLYLSAILAGASIGFSESPGVTYVCEITTPKLRGILVMCNNYSLGLGSMLMFLLCSFLGWRTCCLVCVGWNVFSMLLLVFIPDSPIWLLNKGRTEDAIKALRWLRGWVPETAVKAELEDHCHFIKMSNLDINRDNDANNSFWDVHYLSLKLVFKSGTLRPFVLILVIWFFGLHSSLAPAKSYFLVILDGLKLPLDSNWIGFLYATSSWLGGAACVLAVRILGKRVLALSSIALTSLLSLAMSMYILFPDALGNRWIFIILYVLQAFTHICIVQTPWIMMGELYPLNTRSIATGMTAAALYFCSSFYVKIYYFLLQLMSTEAIFAMYSCFGLVGFFYLWIFMPETEGKTMAVIQELFADDARTSCPHFHQHK